MGSSVVQLPKANLKSVGNCLPRRYGHTKLLQALPVTVQVGLTGTVGDHFPLYASYLKKGYSGHVGLCDVAFKTAVNVLFCLKF